MTRPQQRFLAAMTALVVLALAAQGLTGAHELVLFMTPGFLLAALLLSDRFVGEQRIARGYAAARRRPRRPVHRPRWRPLQRVVPTNAITHVPPMRRGPPALAA